MMFAAVSSRPTRGKIVRTLGRRSQPDAAAAADDR
jgi:hypothetical protein